MKPLVIKVEVDEWPFLRLTRVGNWLLCHDYETGEGQWEWSPERRNDAEQSAEGTPRRSVA